VIRDAPARRLLAGLVDEQALETEPIAEVRADLAALGLDPARAVALARRLAAGTASPAVALLGKIAAAEDDDDEIARLERAEAHYVRRRVGEGVAAAAVANAQRAAGGQSNVAGLRRRRPRRLLYGLGGLAVALAASVVFYVGLSPDQVYRGTHETTPALQKATGFAPATNETGAARPPTTPPPAEPYGTVVDPTAEPLPAQSADSGAAGSSRAPASLTDSLQSRMQPAAKGPAEVAGQTAAAPAAPQQQSADAEAKAKDQLKSEADDKDTGGNTLGSRPEPQPADAPTQTATSTATRALGEPNAEELRGGALANQVAAPFGINRPIVALLIVDPKLVPSGLKQENYPTGDLSARLDDARRLAGNRPVAALVTVQLLGRPTDAVVIVGTASELMLRRDVAKTAESSASSAAAGNGYDMILLDRR
jgi:hypothetical protein